MAGGVTESYSSSPMDDKNRFGGTVDELEEKEDPLHPLDNDENQQLLKRLLNWYEHERTIQAPNRYQMALDCDYYDSMQWTEEEAQVLMERGQAPTVFNEIKPTIDWMIGTERRARIDYKVLPRRGDKESRQDAENKTQLLKYLSDVNKTPFKRSKAFEDAVKAGVGWIETGIKGDPTEELLYTRNEDWRNCLGDSTSVEPDASDMRFFFRKRWLDTDIAIAYFPDRKDIIEQAATQGESLIDIQDDEELWFMGARVTAAGQDYPSVSTNRYQPYSGGGLYGTTRDRVLMKECWYKEPVLKRKFSGGDYQNEVFDSNNAEHLAALKGGYSLYDKLELEIFCAIFCNAGLVWVGKSPYKHGRIPFVPVWCYRRKRDNAPYGAIRTLRDPQDDLNKRRSKAQWILSTNRVIMDDGAVDDVDELREEVARPDAVIVKKSGKSLEIERDTNVARQHLDMMEDDIAHIRNAGGVNNENLGRTSNTTSGIALQERKESGSVVTTEPFDNLRFAVQLVGEMELSNVEQFYSQQKTVRIIGDRGGVKFQDLNQPADDGSILNDITKFQADFVVSEQDYRSSLRQAMFESLFDIVGRLAQMNPQVALNLLDLVVEMADLPNKDELVSRIRKLNGQADPDKEETPEEAQARMAQEQQAMQEQNAQKELILAKFQRDIAKLVAETGKLDAQTVETKIKAMYAALQAAGVIATVPAAAAIADEMLKGSGFKDAAVEQNQQMIEEAAGQMQQQQPPPQQTQPNPAAEAAMTGVNAGIQTPEIEGVQQ